MIEVVKNIINIDKETVKIKLKTEEIIHEKEKELRETLVELEKKYTEEARVEGEEVYTEIINQGNTEINRLESLDIEALQNIENIYIGKKNKLVEDLWSSLFIGKE